jgi:hypothetical protein
MPTLIVSDLHLGSRSGVDLLRHREIREVLWRELETVDRLVLLGDVLELRHGPHRDALQVARPFFQELGEMFAGREVVVLAGNHDYALMSPWLSGRGELHTPDPLTPEQQIEPQRASEMLAQIAQWASPAKISAVYPGLWVREDVYATHGHYLDCHLSVPTMECIGIGATARIMGRQPASFDNADDYEAVMAPIFSWIDAVAQRAPTTDALNGQGTVRAWQALRGTAEQGGLRSAVRSKLLATAFPMGVQVLNRAKLGHFQADISGDQLRRAGLTAMREVIGHLGLEAGHVIFGHTHRSGPLPSDLASEWNRQGAVGLMNCGCWTYDSYFLGSTASKSPHWPGACVLVDDDGPPVLRRLLLEHTDAQLRRLVG